MYSNDDESNKYNDIDNLSQFLIYHKNEHLSYEELSSEEKNFSKMAKYFLNNNIEKSTINLTSHNDTKKKLFNDNLNNSINQKKRETSNTLHGNKKLQKVKRKNWQKKNELNDNNKIVHNKYSDDSLRRKIKHLVLKYVLIFLNERIKTIYNGKIGLGLYVKHLKTINQKQTKDSRVSFNKQFLQLKIKDIFSTNITKKYTSFPVYHNKNLINKLLNENDENKREYFNKLFNLEFIECLKYFRGEKHIDILKGLKCFKDIKDEIVKKYEEDGEKYYKTIEEYINNYESKILGKTPRKSRK